MNRRFFLNSLGAAILGTAIALKIPDSIIPRAFEFSRPKITFKALSEAYRNCCAGNKEPDTIIVKPEVYKDIHNLCLANDRTLYTNENGFIRFFNAEIKPDNVGIHKVCTDMFGFGHLKENEILVSGPCYGNLGTFYFV